MTMWGFFDNHWALALVGLCFTYHVSTRLIRMIMVLARGWPSPPLDADGDVVWPEKPRDEAA